jgi:flagellar biosynthesis protein FlhF
MAQKSLPITPGQKYKFIVKSAEEAAAIIRDKLGETAQVISVRQVEGEGLARFLKSPKLEIIAQVPLAPSENSEAKNAAEAQSESADSGEESESPQRRKASRSRKARVTLPSTELPRGEADYVSETLVRAMFNNLPTGRLWTILSKAGIPTEFLAQIGEQPETRGLNDQPLQTAISRFALLMRDRAPGRSLSLSNRVVFFGSPGSGSTTALCKQLSSDVFLRGRQACVMKLNSDEPNSSEGLAMFCEALGVPLLRTTAELRKIPEEAAVYFDMPGMMLTGKNIRYIQKIFDELGILSRVLVVNAAYERQLIQEAYTRGSAVGATHVVFTHVDEIPRCGKLWEFVLDDGLVPLFASTGQNIASDFDRHVIDLLVRRTLTAGDE